MDIRHELCHQLTEFYEKMSSWEHSVIKLSTLSLPQMHTIEILGSCGTMRMKELAEKLSVTTGTLTVTIDALEKLDMVRRERHPDDRRSYIIVLTEKGNEEFETHHRLHTELTHELSGGFTDDEVHEFNRLMKNVLKRF